MSADPRTTKYRFTQVGAVFALLVLVAVLAAATYAWFTNNAAVNTDSVSVHSDDSRLVVELGDASAGSWSRCGSWASATPSAAIWATSGCCADWALQSTAISV